MKVGNIESVISDMEKGVLDRTVNGKCSCCGDCCSALLPVSKAEIKAIMKYVKNNDIKPVRHTLLMKEDTVDLCCPFLDNSKEKKCLIYPVRPEICKVFMCNVPPSKIEKDKGQFMRSRDIFDMWELIEPGNGVIKKIMKNVLKEEFNGKYKY